MTALDGKTYRSDIHIGAEAMRLAVDSFGKDGSPSTIHLMDRAKQIYAWLLLERK